MSLRPLVQVLWRTTYLQLRLLNKAWAARLTDLFMPSAVALVPVILGRAVAGDEAGFNFAQYTHTANFAGFLLLGGGSFLLVTRALWGFSNWLREEMRGGTLESLYLARTPMPVILAGVALAFMSYSALMFSGAMLVGAFLFQVLFHTNQLAVALVFLVVGLPSIYGVALLYGALVLRLKEADAFFELAQWLLTLLMGVYFPITLFPPALRLVSLLFPPTWLTHGLRSALLNIPFLSSNWLIDLGILMFFGLAGPCLGYFAFSRVEKGLRATSGLGAF